MGKKRDKSYKPFHKLRKSAKDYDRKRDKNIYPKWLEDKFEEVAKWKPLWDN